MIADYLSVFNDTCVLFVKVPVGPHFFAASLFSALNLFSTHVFDMSFNYP